MNRFSSNDNEGECDYSQTLTYQEMEIAKSFLRKRFPEYSLKEIISSLYETNKSKNRHKLNLLRQKQFYDLQNDEQKSSQEYEKNEMVKYSGKNSHRNKKGFKYNSKQKQQIYLSQSHITDQIDKFSEQRVVAKIFCESGVNFSLAKYFFPKMTLKAYRSHVEIINSQTINEIEKFLRYEYNLQIERLNRNQKKSIRTQMVKIREWLGRTDIDQLQTYYKFIQRHYQQTSMNIEYKDAIKLYKTILQIVKENEYGNKKMQQDEFEGYNRSKQQQKQIIFLYNEHKCIDKVSNILCENYGSNRKWSKYSLRLFFKSILNHSLKKLILSVQKYASEKLRICFSFSDQNVDLLLQNQNFIDIKIKLLNFYFKTKVKINELVDILKQVNKFYIKFNPHDDQNSLIDSVQIPKLEGQSTKMEVENEDLSKIKEIKKQQEVFQKEVKQELLKINQDEAKKEENIQNQKEKKQKKRKQINKIDDLNQCYEYIELQN